MTQEIETVTFTKVVPLADADGRAIREGSVLREINDGEQGVVTWIGRAGGPSGPAMASVGDIAVQKSSRVTRVTNRYSQWRHVSHIEQSYAERYLSWMHRPHDHDEDGDISKDEAMAIDGIMALLPDDIVDWDYGPHPDRLEDALRFLADHLQSKENAEVSEGGARDSRIETAAQSRPSLH